MVTQVKNEAAVRRRANTRAKVLEAAIAVFAERGARRVTVDDLAGAAGYTRGAFYSNFDSIEEVLLAAFREQSERMLTALRAATTQAATTRGAATRDLTPSSLVAAMLVSVRPYERQWYALHAEVSLLCLRDEEARVVAGDLVGQLDDQLREVAEIVLETFDRTPTVSAQMLGEAALALYLHSLGVSATAADAEKAEELVTEVLPRVIEGLSVPLSPQHQRTNA